uniref:Claudin n=1 Tax=Astyanax mexicanus TaxID=7994 RepID=A0A8B9GNK9_ASTMX
MSAGRKMMGIALGLTGWIFAIVTSLLPMWKISDFTGANLVESLTVWEGIWMNCVVQSSGQKHCRVYDSVLALPSDLQAGRTTTLLSILTALLALTVSILGVKSTSYIQDETTKLRTVFISGVLLVIAGFLMLIPVSWTSSRIMQGLDNYEDQKWSTELGASLYTGFISSAMLITGGGFLSCSSRPWRRR